MKRFISSLFGIMALGFVFIWAAPAQADNIIDLTTAGSGGSDGAILFQQINPQSTGTGLIDSFAQIGGNSTITDAYNTTVHNTLFNGSSDNFNHALALSSVPTVLNCIFCVAGVTYYELNLDVNQTGESPLLSLTDIQVFLTSTGNQNTTSKDGSGLLLLNNAALVYRLDGNPDNDNDTVELNYILNNGSGSGDMTMLIPKSLFDAVIGANPTFTSLVLYSKFGDPNVNNDGFEEWFTCKNKSTGDAQACTGSTTGTNSSGGAGVGTPEPASLLLLGMGLVLGARRLSKRAKLKD